MWRPGFLQKTRHTGEGSRQGLDALRGSVENPGIGKQQWREMRMTQATVGSLGKRSL